MKTKQPFKKRHVLARKGKWALVTFPHSDAVWIYHKNSYAGRAHCVGNWWLIEDLDGGRCKSAWLDNRGVTDWHRLLRKTKKRVRKTLRLEARDAKKYAAL